MTPVVECRICACGYNLRRTVTVLRAVCALEVHKLRFGVSPRSGCPYHRQGRVWYSLQ